MRGGFPLFRFRGIRVLVHWSFALLPAYVAFSGLTDGAGLTTILTDIGLILILFCCVLLHEFGHALTAQHFGVGTRDITLLPIGGVASLERMPEDPKQEFWITVAGPLVNLVIAGIALLLLLFTGIGVLFNGSLGVVHSWPALLGFIFASNIGLFLFNLVPAFPMDGGRILRSVLSMRWDRERSTRIASTIGRVFAVGFVGIGLLRGEPFLALIGVFIFMAAGAEARQVSAAARAKALEVRGIMRSTGPPLPLSITPAAAWQAMTLADQEAVMVQGPSGQFGLVLKEDLRQMLAMGQENGSIIELAHPASRVTPTDSAHTTYKRAVEEGIKAFLVQEGDEVLGILLRTDLEKALQQAMTNAAEGSA